MLKTIFKFIKILGGVLIAGFESVIICPMERLKVNLQFLF